MFHFGSSISEVDAQKNLILFEDIHLNDKQTLWDEKENFKRMRESPLSSRIQNFSRQHRDKIKNKLQDARMKTEVTLSFPSASKEIEHLGEPQ